MWADVFAKTVPTRLVINLPTLFKGISLLPLHISVKNMKDMLKAEWPSDMQKKGDNERLMK